MKHIFQDRRYGLKKRMLAFLEFTMNHYNFDNRSYSEALVACTYAPSHEDTLGCAIGQWVPDKNRCEEWDEGLYGLEDIKNELPKWMQDMSTYFLLEVQNLHDSNKFWNEKGISELGVLQVNQLKTDFELWKAS